MHAIDATEIATRLLGDSIAANLFTLGFAWQKGLVPVSEQAIAEAVRLNGVGVKMNLAAFLWGRRAAVDEAAVRALIDRRPPGKPDDLAAIVARRVAFLVDYQDAAYADSYRNVVERVRQVSEPLARAVAVNLFKLMAYKAEYEVARLHSDGRFAAEIAQQFKGDYKLTFHLAPPILGRRDGFTGKPVKSSFGPWMMTVFGLLAKFRGLRGTAFDIFGHTVERRMERQLIADYRATIEGLLPSLGPSNIETAVEIASLPAMIRGFGHVKEASVAKARLREAELLRQFSGTTPKLKAAAE
jgi:indolepyruvate ferredoxin oxidoreductase